MTTSGTLVATREIAQNAIVLVVVGALVAMLLVIIAFVVRDVVTTPGWLYTFIKGVLVVSVCIGVMFIFTADVVIAVVVGVVAAIVLRVVVNL